jgi:hypothetical protein
MSGVPKLVPEPFWVPLCNQNSLPQFTSRETPSPLITMSSGTWQGWPWWARDAELVTRSWKHCSLNPIHEPQEYCRRAQRDRVPKLTGSKFIKQAGSNSADSHPKLNAENKGSLPYIPFRAGYWNGGYSLSHTWSHTTSLAILTSGVRWPFSDLTPRCYVSFLKTILFSLFHCCTHYLSLSLIIFLPPPSFLPQYVSFLTTVA